MWMLLLASKFHLQFQRRKYAKFKWFRCGKKGYGLQLQEDVSQGSFLIEYVGEVGYLSLALKKKKCKNDFY